MRRGAVAVPVQERELTGCFFLFRDGEEDGPFALDELKAMQEAGALSPATPCRARREREWHDLAYLLKAAAREESPEEPSSGEVPGGETGAGQSHQEESLRVMLRDLLAVSRRQNGLLSSIKWSLVVLIVMTAGLIVALQ